MSIIFQTLNKLHKAPPVEPLPQAEDAQRSGSGSSHVRPRKNMVVAGIVFGAFIILGFAFIFSVKFLATHISPTGGDASANQNVTASADFSSADVRSQGQVPPQSVAPQYIPPDRAQPSLSMAASDPLPSEIVTQSAQTSSLPPAHIDNREVMPPSMDTQHAGNQNIPASPPTVRESALIGDDAASIMRMKALSEAPAEPSKIPEPVSADRLRAEKARNAVREKIENISRLVSQLESALAGPSGQSQRIETLLIELERLKQPDSTYVDKLRAYWLLKEEKYDQAKAILEKVAATDEKDMEVIINLAVIDIRTGNSQAALRRLQRLKQAYPESTQIADLLRKLQ